MPGDAAQRYAVTQSRGSTLHGALLILLRLYYSFVTGAKRDDLQAAMAILRKDVPDMPLEFNNFRD